MPSYVEVAVNVPQVSGTFHYHLPPELEGLVQPGQLVEVPFAHQQVQGIVFRFVDQPEVAQTRPVTALIDAQSVVTPQQIALASQLAYDTLSPLAACISLMIPPGLGKQADTLYTLLPRQADPAHLTPLQRRLVAALQERGPLRGRQLEAAFRRVDWRASVRALLRQGWLSAQSVLPVPSVRPKTVRTAQLAVSAQAALAQMGALGRANTPALTRRQAMLRLLLGNQEAIDVAWLYAESGGSRSDLLALEQRGLVSLAEAETWRDPLMGLEFVPSQPPPLTDAQQAVWQEIRLSQQAAREGQAVPPILLHGVTGSGKTEIYLHAVQEALDQGRQAIVLVPEIALTPQTIRRFLSRFPGLVGVLHSRLSEGERYDTWRRARLGEINVMVGPRSALFTPFARLGLIVLDEFHDDTYYQADMHPHYHTRQAAIAYAQLSKAVCLLGSATPDVASRYQASQGEWRYLSLPRRILAHRQAVENQVRRLGVASRYRPESTQAETIDLPPVEVADMRQELMTGNRSIFSRRLQGALEDVLKHNQQAILFLNRRGAATYVFCRDCGEAVRCPRCDLPLTQHTSSASAGGVLACHYCGYQRNMPRVCPNCKSERIRAYGTGTEKVENDVQALFPQARTLRWDYETTRQKGAHDIILSHFSNHQADILIGTQMIAKGLDLPLVTLVGVILADVGLSLPDLRAAERTFQVLTQVAGRAGRSLLGGQVILQTFLPEHYVIRAASQHDYQAFYQEELERRRQIGYPPFARLVRLEYRHRENARAEAAALALKRQVESWLESSKQGQTEIVGPAPCFFSRLSGYYRWQIVLRGPDPTGILRGRPLPPDWHIEVDPPSLL